MRAHGHENEYWLDRSDPPLGHKRLRTDAGVRDAVLEALTTHGGIDATAIDVGVTDGVVTLAGTVDDRRELELAEDIVGCCPGVRDIRNELTIGSNPTDGIEVGTDTTRA